jgi:hypothetical protein
MVFRWTCLDFFSWFQETHFSPVNLFSPVSTILPVPHDPLHLKAAFYQDKRTKPKNLQKTAPFQILRKSGQIQWSTVFTRVICSIFFSNLAAEKSGCVKYADFSAFGPRNDLMSLFALIPFVFSTNARWFPEFLILFVLHGSRTFFAKLITFNLCNAV